MSPRREVPTVYWQAIVAHNLVVRIKKERMSHLCDSTVAGPTARRDNVLTSKCEYPPSITPLLNEELISLLLLLITFPGVSVTKVAKQTPTPLQGRAGGRKLSQGKV